MRFSEHITSEQASLRNTPRRLSLSFRPLWTTLSPPPKILSLCRAKRLSLSRPSRASFSSSPRFLSAILCACFSLSTSVPALHLRRLRVFLSLSDIARALLSSNLLAHSVSPSPLGRRCRVAAAVHLHLLFGATPTNTASTSPLVMDLYIPRYPPTRQGLLALVATYVALM